MKELVEISHFLGRSVGTEQITWSISKNKQGVLLKRNITLFPSFSATAVYGVSLLFILFQSIAIR